ncbi:MAG: hypothetical protein D6808_05575 [Candidatus Dadabacteria bacterium]|nr:MAG: hypothetical protein D6808_05575 [Candidatus Dadabacteria bacterium]
MGIVGFIGLLAVISAFKVKEDVKGIVGNAPLALLIMLFFGPHLNFDEVLVLTAFVSSLCLEHKPKLLLARFSLLKKAVMVFLFGAILYRSYLSQYGFYPAEFNKSTKEIIEWSRKKGVGWVSCDDGIGRISLRAINPDVARNPVKVSVKSSLGQLEDIELRDFSQRIVELDCADLKKLRYSFYISRLWNPSDFGMVHDSRSLGVQFVLPYDKWKL